MSRIPWNKFETALLIDTYIAVDEKKQPRSIAVKSLSKLLRDMGEMNGVDIDEIYRNENGISMRLYEIERLFNDGKGGLKNTSKLFVEMVEMYKNDRNGFNQILKESQKMIGQQSISKKGLFRDWLQKHSENVENIDDVIETLDIVSMFITKHKISDRSLWEIDNSEDYDGIIVTLSKSYLFKVLHRDAFIKLRRFSKQFKDFLSEWVEESGNRRKMLIDKEELSKEIIAIKETDIQSKETVIKRVKPGEDIDSSDNEIQQKRNENSAFDIEDINAFISELKEKSKVKEDNVTLEEKAEDKTESISINSRTIIDAVVIVLQKADDPLSISEIYDKILKENLYVFGAQKPENVLEIQIKRACRDSNISQKLTKYY